MFGLFDEVFDLAVNVTKVVIAPVAVVATVANTVVQPVAEVAEDIVSSLKELP